MHNLKYYQGDGEGATQDDADEQRELIELQSAELSKQIDQEKKRQEAAETVKEIQTVSNEAVSRSNEVSAESCPDCECALSCALRAVQRMRRTGINREVIMAAIARLKQPPPESDSEMESRLIDEAAVGDARFPLTPTQLAGIDSRKKNRQMRIDAQLEKNAFEIGVQHARLKTVEDEYAGLKSQIPRPGNFRLSGSDQAAQMHGQQQDLHRDRVCLDDNTKVSLKSHDCTRLFPHLSAAAYKKLHSLKRGHSLQLGLRESAAAILERYGLTAKNIEKHAAAADAKVDSTNPSWNSRVSTRQPQHSCMRTATPAASECQLLLNHVLSACLCFQLKPPGGWAAVVNQMKECMSKLPEHVTEEDLRDLASTACALTDGNSPNNITIGGARFRCTQALEQLLVIRKPKKQDESLGSDELAAIISVEELMSLGFYPMRILAIVYLKLVVSTMSVRESAGARDCNP